MNRKNKTRIKRIRTEARIITKNVWYVKWLLHWRPKMQKLFFPICALVLLIGILNYERNERGTMEFTNAAVVMPNSVVQEAEVSIPANEPTLAAIESHIRSVFPEEPEVAVAVAKSESGLDPNAKGYNCRYGTKSTSCKPEDREKAWSVDCGLWQINVVSQECPEHLMNPEVNTKIAKEMQSKRGWTPWVGFWSGQWKNHLN